ncbi:1,4-dihydroxy-2-naphthoate polyprenyltransferase [uncultured Desulfobacter sp.]|uniref:1,4-dihydroxy-2-naphthoate polyprenyltransferase n=1 Tax=uncultured Desulfobacter sp. TaxID=240139 RepID=UPI002AAAF0C4|nr:1,4-dihydroxy-2-naphthoate polyprenyltransferase [uncultured Desulfobacter sp.]
MNLHHWWLAIRPKTLPAAACPVVVGAACAFIDHRFSVLMFAAALSGALLIQISVNLANDYFDFKHNIDTPDRKGPKRMTQSGLIPPETVRNAFILTMLVALGLGIFLIFKGGIVIFYIVAASLLGVLCYSAGPFPIASNGLGEAFVFIFFGPVAVLGTYYLMAECVTWTAITASVPVGFLVTAIIVVNNLRDMKTDARAGKRTLAVILGPWRTKVEFVFLILFSFLIPCLMFASGRWSWTILLPLAVFWKSYPIFDTIFKEDGEILNQALADTAKLALMFSALFAIGIMLG